MGYKEEKGVGIGVSQRDKRGDFRHYVFNLIYDLALSVPHRKTPGFSALRPHLRYSTYSRCTVSIVQLLLQYAEVKRDEEGRGSVPQNSFGKQQLFITIYSVVCMYNCMYFASMHYNISVVCLCRRELC